MASLTVAFRTKKNTLLDLFAPSSRWRMFMATSNEFRRYFWFVFFFLRNECYEILHSGIIFGVWGYNMLKIECVPTESRWVRVGASPASHWMCVMETLYVMPTRRTYRYTHTDICIRLRKHKRLCHRTSGSRFLWKTVPNTIFCLAKHHIVCQHLFVGSKIYDINLKVKPKCPTTNSGANVQAVTINHLKCVGRRQVKLDLDQIVYDKPSWNNTIEI